MSSSTAPARGTTHAEGSAEQFEQPRASLNLTGGLLSHSARFTGHSYQYQQQQAIIAELQAQAQAAALAAAGHQQHYAGYAQPYLQGLPKPLQQQEQQHPAGHPRTAAYPAMGFSQRSPVTHIHASCMPSQASAAYHPGFCSINPAGGFQGPFQTPQHIVHQLPFSLQAHNRGHSSPLFSPFETSQTTPLQIHHSAGGEPANAYRLVTQSQLAQLPTTPIPDSIPTAVREAVKLASQLQECTAGEHLNGPSSDSKTHAHEITMSSAAEDAALLDRESHSGGQSGNSSSLSSTDNRTHRGAPLSAAPAPEPDSNSLSVSPLRRQQQQAVNTNMRFLSDATPPLSAQQSHPGSETDAPESNKQLAFDSMTENTRNVTTQPNSAASTISSSSACIRPAISNATTSMSACATGPDLSHNPPTQASLSPTPVSSSPSNPTFYPSTAPFGVPEAHLSRTGATGANSSQDTKQGRRPTLTVDTSILNQTAAPPPALVMQNPIIHVAAPALPQHTIYEMPAVLHDPSYAIEIQPAQLATMYTQASAPGYATLRTLQLNHALTTAFKKQEAGAIDQCVADFFHKDGKFKFSMSEEGRDEPSNEYLIPTCAIPRFYESMRRCGATSIQLVLDDPQEWLLSPDSGAVMADDGSSGYMVECQNATLIVSYSTGSTVFSRGTCRATYHYEQADPLLDEHGRLLSSYRQMTLLLSQLEYDFVEHTEMVKRSAIRTRKAERAAADVDAKDRHMPHSQRSVSRRQSVDDAQITRSVKRPKIESQTGSYNSKEVHAICQPGRINSEESESISRWQECSIPGPPVRDTGLSDETMRVLEIGEAVDHLGELICFSLINNLSPLEALEHYATLSVKAGFVPDPTLSEGGYPKNVQGNS